MLVRTLAQRLRILCNCIEKFFYFKQVTVVAECCFGT